MSSPSVLMLAYLFPPASGSGSHRALAFARYLPMYGWRPIVLTPDCQWAAPRDDRLLAEVPRGLRVVRTRSLEPTPGPPRAVPDVSPRPPKPWRAQLGHLKRFPDAHLGWLPYAFATGRRIPADIINSSSGPFTSHLLGLALKRATGRAWVAELRDGWYAWNRAIFPDYPAWRGALERRLEAAAMRSADRVVLVTERMRDAFIRQYPDVPEERFAVVSNGFDPVQFSGRIPLLGAVNDTGDADHFTVVHTGALYHGRSLIAFLDAAQRVRNARFGKRFRLRLIGTLDAAARAEIERHPIAGHVELCGQLEHAAALHAMRRADLLLLVANQTHGADATVPAKLFEYLATGRPIFALAPRESSSADVLARTGGAWLAPADDVPAVTAALATALAAHDSGEATAPDPRHVARFDRRLLARDLARIFDEARAARRV